MTRSVFVLLVALLMPAPSAAQARIADGRYWTLVGAHAAATVADIELTVHVLKKPGITEANPFWPDRPTRLRLYSVSAAVNVGVAVATYYAKRQGVSWWWVPLGLGVTAHGVAVGWNLQW